jgi:transcriptional regulator with XRE-family HTH domain
MSREKTSLEEKLILIRGGMSKAEMANLLNVPPIYITRDEKGDIKPTIDFLVKLQKTMHVNLNWLLADQGDPYWDESKISRENLDLVVEMLKIARDSGDILASIYREDFIKEAKELIRLTAGLKGKT